jgi:hypothetical protein
MADNVVPHARIGNSRCVAEILKVVDGHLVQNTAQDLCRLLLTGASGCCADLPGGKWSRAPLNLSHFPDTRCQP